MTRVNTLSQTHKQKDSRVAGKRWEESTRKHHHCYQRAKQKRKREKVTQVQSREELSERHAEGLHR